MAPAWASLKPVQLKDGAVPEHYIQPKDEAYHNSLPLPLMEAPAIDLAQLLSSNPHQLGNLHSSLTSWGMAQIVNHGIESELLDEVREMSKEFFKLPIEEKEKYSSNGLEGYGNDFEHQKTGINWSDRLHLHVHPHQNRQLQCWPQNPLNFRKTLDEYSIKIRVVLEEVLKAMARSLKLEENKFSELWRAEEDTIHARFNFYPQCPSSDLVIGMKTHTDGTAITILLQDKEVEALQVLKDNQWFRVPIIPEALVIIVGDQMEIASNGIFKGPLHKVTVNPQYDRVSLAMLSLPNVEKEIGPIPELINEERPQMYKRLKNYGEIFLKYLGERQINAVKIKY